MSWQVAAFGILAAGLAGGFAWYEWTGPDARIVALVGTLAAFAALGRIAFVAVPNVKPTTDIVLISGYALGGAPGFVVGAVAGLASNFFFGQGPWTPWQMAAWGVAGLVGAVLARVSGRRASPNRWLLAFTCMLVGFAFTAVQDVGDWVTYSDHSLSQLGVYVGKGLGFDAVHAVSCAAFALAFGPALARSIGRFAGRIRVVWRPLGGTAAALLPALLLSSAVWLLGPQARSADASTTPVAYLLSAQNPDGGFGATPGAPSSTLYSGWAALGLASQGYNPLHVRRAGRPLSSYVLAGSDTDPGSLERTILALRAAGLGAAGQLAQLQRDVKANGSVSGQVNLTSFAVLALRAAGVQPPGNMIAWLTRQQDGDGGFNFATRGGASDLDDTGAALEALAGTGSGAVPRAVRFIDRHENRDGGFPSQTGASSNAQSTAWVVQGLIAAGAGTSQLSRPLGYLRSLVASDGHVEYAHGQDQTPVWVTAEVLMALAGKPLPLASVAVSQGRRRATSPAPAAPARHAHPPRSKRAVGKPKHGSGRPQLTRLVSDLGLLDALALAPIG